MLGLFIPRSVLVGAHNGRVEKHLCEVGIFGQFCKHAMPHAAV